MRTVDQHLREPKQDGRFNRLMAFKRGTGGAWAMGGRAQEEVGLAGLRAFTGLLLAFRAARSLHQPPFCVCVSRQAITLMIIYDRGHRYVSPGRN